MFAPFSLLCLLLDAAATAPPPVAMTPPPTAAPPEVNLSVPVAGGSPARAWRTFGDAALTFTRDNSGPGARVQSTVALRLERLGVEGGRWLAPWLRGSAAAEIGSASESVRDSARVETARGVAVRQLYLRAETPVLDLLAGVTLYLFGAGETYRPATLQLGGLPGQVAVRGEQLRLTHVFRGQSAELELAAGVTTSKIENLSPDWQGRIRFAWQGLRGVHTAGPALTTEEPLSLSLSGLYRRITLNQYRNATLVESMTFHGRGVSLDMLVPMIPARLNDGGHALTFTGSLMIGQGINDVLSPVSRNVIPRRPVEGPVPGSMGDAPLPPQGSVGLGSMLDFESGSFRVISATAVVLGLQYRPARGPVWVSANHSRAHRDQPKVGPDQLVPVRDFLSADVNLFVDPIPHLRCGAEFQWLGQTFSDGTSVSDRRFLVAALGMF